MMNMGPMPVGRGRGMENHGAMMGRCASDRFAQPWAKMSGLGPKGNCGMGQGIMQPGSGPMGSLNHTMSRRQATRSCSPMVRGMPGPGPRCGGPMPPMQSMGCYQGPNQGRFQQQHFQSMSQHPPGMGMGPGSGFGMYPPPGGRSGFSGGAGSGYPGGNSHMSRFSHHDGYVRPPMGRGGFDTGFQPRMSHSQMPPMGRSGGYPGMMQAGDFGMAGMNGDFKGRSFSPAVGGMGCNRSFGR